MNKEELKKELKKCRVDPVYFISKYIKVIHPIRGLVPFKLYDFQKIIIQALHDNRFNILRKFRQAGCTTIASAYSLWFTIFHKHKSVVILSKGDVESTEVLDRIKIMYDELPTWLKPKILEDNKHTLKLSTLSIIKARSAGKQSGRSLAGSLLIVDEAAFIESIGTIWAAVYPIISTGGRAFILSTVNGIGNFFHQTWKDALNKINSFHPIDINWKSHPEYNRTPGFEWLYEIMMQQSPPIDIDKWEEVTRANVSHRTWLQEYENEFLGTGDTYVDGSILRELLININTDFYRKYNNRMRIWKNSDPNSEYVMGVDTGLGRERDYSTFVIIDIYSGEQIAEFYSNKTPINEFSKIIYDEALIYNTPYIIIERNTIGNNLIERLFVDFEYENLWADTSQKKKHTIGVQVTNKNRDNLLANMEEAVRLNRIKINSERLVKELFTFVVNDAGKVEADSGCQDDLIFALTMAIHCLNTITDNTPISTRPGDSKYSEPLAPMRHWKYPISTTAGIEEEDLKWLLDKKTS